MFQDRGNTLSDYQVAIGLNFCPLCKGVVNALGEVIGINTFIMTGSNYSSGSIGIGFAIPINRVKEVAEDLKKYSSILLLDTSGQYFK